MSTARDNPRDVIRASLKASVRTSGGGGADLVTSAAKLFHLEAENYVNGSTWPDSGPNGYTFTKYEVGTITKTASWTNGLPALEFAGANEHFLATDVTDVGSAPSGRGFAFFMVGEFNGTADNRVVGLAPSDDGSSDADSHMWRLRSGTFVLDQVGFYDVTQFPQSSVPAGSPWVVGCRFPASPAGGNTTTYSLGNGTTTADSVVRRQPIYVPDAPLVKWRIGHGTSVFGPSFDGKMAEVIVYGDDITQQEMEDKVQELADKYAILGA